MISTQAEQSFRNGKTLIDEGRMRDALPFLRSAVDSDEQLNGESRQARYLSYYGLSLCFSLSNPRYGLGLCRTAVEEETYNPDLWCNLGRVAHALGRRQEAYRALQRGRKQQSDHPGIRQELARLGTRRPPIFTFLSRSHPINVFFGRFRASMAKRTTARRADSARPRPNRVRTVVPQGLRHVRKTFN